MLCKMGRRPSFDSGQPALSEQVRNFLLNFQFSAFLRTSLPQASDGCVDKMDILDP